MTSTDPTLATYHKDLYEDDTPLAIIKFFEAQLNRTPDSDRDWHENVRYRVHYGNTITGRCWGEYDEGTVALNNEEPQGLMMLATPSTKEGPLVLTGSIVRIDKLAGRSVEQVYRHPTYHTHEEEARVAKAEVQPERRPRRIVLRGNADGDT